MPEYIIIHINVVINIYPLNTKKLTKAYSNAADIAVIFSHLTAPADKEKNISPFYSDDFYHACAPSLNITTITNSPSTAHDFNAVFTILGVPAGPLGGIPAAAPVSTTVYIQKEDKALTEPTVEILTRQRALFLTADIDWSTCSITAPTSINKVASMFTVTHIALRRAKRNASKFFHRHPKINRQGFKCE